VPSRDNINVRAKQIETLALLAVQWSGARVPKSRSNFTPLQTKGKG
jgi:hypothetical protein